MPCDVMVIDDEEVVRAGIRKVLESEGLGVTDCADAATALAHPDLPRCRLVLCDLMLPDRSGTDLMRDLLQRRPGLPVVLITGYATLAEADRARDAGAFDFLPKPFEASELMHVVRRALTGASRAAREEGT
ncbi:MAG TPA: response regulator [Candidatus Polarisedimenticolia bacterium]|nr:response regulator [Candidatus Polarisedimenticolia bacterium]